MKFKKVNPKEDLIAKELEILEFWDKEKIFEKSLEQRKDAERFVFFEGPPTANAKPGLHHVEGRAFKDLFPRFKTMQGYLVERKAGWDTHGLPVEIAVEKKLGLKNKTDIEKYGIAKFNAEAKKSVWEFKKDWEQNTKRLGFWLDLENPYITYDSKYVESLWWIIKQVWDKELLYKGYRVVHHCPRCGTALSSHEVAQGYNEVEETSVYVKFKLKEEDNTYILAWTTTPWTLPGNVALAVDPEIEYVKVRYFTNNRDKKNDPIYENLILAKDIYEQADDKKHPLYELHTNFASNKPEGAPDSEANQILETISGKDLLDKEYEPLFPGAIKTDKKAWYIVPAGFVTTEDGTGVVHTAVMYGEDDYQLGKKLDLPQIHTVDEEGKFMAGVKQWAGRFVKDPEVEKEMITDLKKHGLLFKEQDYKHDYPFCWRCNTPLLYYAKDSWFIAMSKLRDKLVENNEKINWIPSHMQQGRFGEWLREIKDWSFSRERYWGTPLPIWQSEDGDFICIGSFEELKELAVDKKQIDEDFDPHRPFVDDIILKKGGKEYKRVPEVIDVWFDSGAMPFAQWHYPFENKERIDDNQSYPADFISEAQDQTRGWFYTLLAVATLLDREIPYKNVLVQGMVLDKKGKKMSKSKGNIVNPAEMFDKYGADVVRWYFYSVNQPYENKVFDEDTFKQIIRRFVLTLWNTYSFFVTYATLDNFVPAGQPKRSTNVLDQWILGRIHEVTKNVGELLENYDPFKSSVMLEEMVNDLSKWYVRRSRKRFWKSENIEDQMAAYQTLYTVLKQLSITLAPFMPFLSEAIYSNLRSEEDPISVHLNEWPKEAEFDQTLLDDMKTVRGIVEKGHFLREQVKIKVRQPLTSVSLVEEELSDELIGIIKDELNIKQVIFGAKKDKLDTKITPDLEKEGLAREIVRAIQGLRKMEGLDVSDRIVLSFDTDANVIKQVFKEHKDYIAGEVLAVNIKTKTSVDSAKEFEINKYQLKLSIDKQ